jgi:hypothetical protein
VFTAFWEFSADGAVLALADGFGSAAKALRVNAAVSKTIIGFFMEWFWSDDYASKLDGFDKPFFVKNELSGSFVCLKMVDLVA